MMGGGLALETDRLRSRHDLRPTLKFIWASIYLFFIRVSQVTLKFKVRSIYTVNTVLDAYIFSPPVLLISFIMCRHGSKQFHVLS